MSTDSLHSDLLIGEVSRCGKLGVPKYLYLVWNTQESWSNAGVMPQWWQTHRAIQM